MKTVETAHVFAGPVPEQPHIPYLLFRPEDWSPSERLPLIVFLHGAGEREEDLNCVKRFGLPSLLDHLGSRRFLLLAPHCVGEEVWNNRVKEIKALIDLVAAEYHADPTRISLTGLSMGGFGTWEMGMSYPGFFSCIAPVCGGGMPWRAYTLKNMPVWAFHGDADGLVDISLSRTMVEAVNACGGQARLTEFPGVDHDSWNQAYGETDVADWLLSHRREGRPLNKS